MPYLVRAVRCIDGDCNFSATNSVQEYNINTRNVLRVVDFLGRKKNLNITPLILKSMMIEQ